MTNKDLMQVKANELSKLKHDLDAGLSLMVRGVEILTNCIDDLYKAIDINDEGESHGDEKKGG